MTDRPILFSAPMVRALLDGRKTQTRRILKPQPETYMVDGAECEVALERTEGEPWPRIRTGRVIRRQQVRFDVGMRLWVRESWLKPFAGPSGYIYRADGPEYNSLAAQKHQWGAEQKWRVSIHMPRVASRLTLAVTGVRVERLQDISEADAKAEGALIADDPCDHHRQTCEDIGCLGQTHKAGFCDIWSAINGNESWTLNPWVLAVSFAVEKRNIDVALKAVA